MERPLFLHSLKCREAAFGVLLLAVGTLSVRPRPKLPLASLNADAATQFP
jgi:hypothetical protein